jgi:hypothetical protein
MRAETLRFLLVSCGFALSLVIAGQVAVAPNAEAAIFTQRAALQSVVADEGAGPDDENEGEDDGGDDLD